MASLVIVSITASASAQSEATVRGQIVAAADGSPVANAIVTLAPAAAGVPIQTTADAGGRFWFQGVSPGEYVLAAARDGFAARTIRIVVEPREARSLTLSLDLVRVQVDVQVRAELGSMPSTHSPSSVLLTRERLDAIPIMQQTNLPDTIVTAAPGMIRGHDDFVHIRGHEVALNPLVNGVTFWENTHSVFSGGLSPAIVESANVMTGGFSAEYGNRFGGVVDIVTKSGLRMQNDGEVAVSGGDARRRSVAGGFGGHRDKLGYYAFGTMFESDRFLSPPDPEAIHDSGRGGHVFLQVDGNLGRAGSLRALVMADGASFDIPKTQSDVELRPWAEADQRTRQQTAIGAWSRAWSQVAAGASFYERFSRSELDPAAGPLTAAASLRRELLTIGGKADVTYFYSRQALKAGVDVVRLRPDENLAYRYGGYRDFAHLAGLPHIHITDNAIDFSGRTAGGQVSAYVQDAISLGARITADLGVRVDRYDLLVTATQASPRANVSIDVGGGAIVHASYNHFFVPPPIEGVLSSAAGLTARIQEIGVPLPPIEPAVENQFELGALLPAGVLRLGLTGYYRNIDNPVHTTVWPDARIYSYASFDRGRAYGFEAKAETPALSRYGVTGYLNYALGRVYFYNPVTGGFVTEAEHISETNRFLAPMDQTHTLTGGVTYRHPMTGLWAGTMLEYGSGTPIGHGGSHHEHAAGEADHHDPESEEAAGRTPGHVSANLSIGIDLWRDGNRRAKLSLQADVENVSGTPYLIARDSEFSAGQYSIPRLVSITARLRF